MGSMISLTIHVKSCVCVCVCVCCTHKIFLREKQIYNLSLRFSRKFLLKQKESQVCVFAWRQWGLVELSSTEGLRDLCPSLSCLRLEAIVGP